MFILIGLVTGVLSAMGVGGGSLLIPLAGLFSTLNQQALQGLNLISFIPSASAATVLYAKEKRFDVRMVLRFAAAALLGAGGGSLLALAVDSEVLRRIFGAFLLILGLWQWIIGEKRHRKQKQEEAAG
ncbi:MAG: TSUP family transporter [Christensenellales bacterium]|jgi:uncharacterized membrane protein YfcA